MTTHTGSQELRDVATQVVAHLGSLRSGLRHRDDTMHWQHVDFCERAAVFAEYVDSALMLGDRGRFAHAFAILRSALDHWAADLVTMLGDRFVQLFPNATDEMLHDAVRRWRAGEMPSVVEEPQRVGKNGSKLRVVRRGLTSADGDDPTVLHPLYFEARSYDPFYGPPDDQPHFADWFADTKDHAIEQRQRYNAFFQWGALVDSLVLNEIVDERHRLHLNTHYRFLSAFVHSHVAAHELLRPRSYVASQGMPHAAEELVLLYVVQLSARYLRAFIAMADRPPQVDLADRNELETTIMLALVRSGHLWFLEDNPSRYDRWHELTVRAGEQRRFTNPSLADVDALGPVEVRYYRNPLERLRRMHITVPVELATGLGYSSPWQGRD